MKQRRRIQDAQILELVVVETLEGSGVDPDPIRRVTWFFTKNGDLLGWHDPCDKTRELDQETLL